MKMILMALTFLFTSTVFGQGVDEYQRLERNYQKLEIQMKDTYKKVLKKPTDQKEEGEGEKRYRIKEQELWLSYRTAYGKLVAHQNNGSGSGSFEYIAKIELTKKRLAELKELLTSSY